MNYLETLKTEASKSVEGLAATVAKLAKQIATIEDRIKYETADVARREANLARFKASAAAKLATSTSAYREWQGRFRRLTLDLATARDALAILENEISPKTKSALEVARGKLAGALTAVCLAVRPSCDTRLAELVDVVVGECDCFLAACVRLHEDNGCVFVPPSFDPGPTATHPRLARCEKRNLTSPAKSLSFTPPPATPAPQAAPVDVPDRQAALGATISDAVDSLDAPDAPGSTRTPAPDAGAVPDDAPAAVQDAPGSETSAQEAPGATRGEPLDTQAAPEGDPEKSGTRLPTILTGNVADLDAQDCAAIDAEYQADLDASAPPDAREI